MQGTRNFKHGISTQPNLYTKPRIVNDKKIITLIRNIKRYWQNNRSVFNRNTKATGKLIYLPSAVE